jgi:hypothetical protein
MTDWAAASKDGSWSFVVPCEEFLKERGESLATTVKFREERILAPEVTWDVIVAAGIPKVSIPPSPPWEDLLNSIASEHPHKSAVMKTKPVSLRFSIFGLVRFTTTSQRGDSWTTSAEGIKEYEQYPRQKISCDRCSSGIFQHLDNERLFRKNFREAYKTDKNILTEGFAFL